jgi:hypothetical protein
MSGRRQVKRTTRITVTDDELILLVRIASQAISEGLFSWNSQISLLGVGHHRLLGDFLARLDLNETWQRWRSEE